MLKRILIYNYTPDDSITTLALCGEVFADTAVIQNLLITSVIRVVRERNCHYFELIESGVWGREGRATYPTILIRHDDRIEVIRLSPHKIEVFSLKKKWSTLNADCVVCDRTVPEVLAVGSRNRRYCQICDTERRELLNKQILSGVYLIWAEGTSIFKIGHSNDIYRRLNVLRTASPVPLKLIALFAGTQTTERLAQKVFKMQNHNLEWFKFEGESVKAVYDFYKKHDAIFIEDGESTLLSMLSIAQELETIDSVMNGTTNQLYSESFIM